MVRSLLLSIACIAIVLLYARAEAYGVSAMPGVPIPDAPKHETPKLESGYTKPLTCESFEAQIKKDITEINKFWEGDFLLHKRDLWAIAVSLRLIANAEAYLDDCTPRKTLTDQEYVFIKNDLLEQLLASEMEEKHDVTQTNYATRVRANAVTLACFAPGSFRPSPDMCLAWKEIRGKKLQRANTTGNRDPMIMFSVTSTTYGFLYRTFCIPH